MQAECLFFTPYADQLNKLAWNIFKLKLKTCTIFTINGFQKAFKWWVTYNGAKLFQNDTN